MICRCSRSRRRRDKDFNIMDKNNTYLRCFFHQIVIFSSCFSFILKTNLSFVCSSSKTIIIFKKNMTFFYYLKAGFKSVDLFYSTQMLRYNNYVEYKTITGGIISLVMVISVMIGFSSMIISTMQRTSITSTREVKKLL